MRENATASTVTVREFRTIVQKFSASTAVLKCSNVTFVGNQTGFSETMSGVGLKAVANIQYTGKTKQMTSSTAVALGQTRLNLDEAERFTARPPLAWRRS